MNIGLDGTGVDLVGIVYCSGGRIQEVSAEIVIQGRIVDDGIVKPGSHLVFFHEQMLVLVVLKLLRGRGSNLNLPRRRWPGMNYVAGVRRRLRFSEKPLVLALHHDRAVLPK